MPDKRDFIAIFKAETEDHLTKLDKGLVELEKHPRNAELFKELNREAHTIKGSARVFGYSQIQEIAHRIEEIFARVMEKKIAFSTPIANKIFKGLDTIRSILEKVGKEEKIDVDMSLICGELDECVGGEIETRGQRTVEKRGVVERKIDKERKEGGDKGERPKNPEGAAERQAQVFADEYIRVPISKVNKLLNLVGEIVVNKMKSSQKIIQAKRLVKLSKETQRMVADLNERVKRTIAFQDSEIVRLLSECNADTQRLKDTSLTLCDNISTEALNLDPVIDELQARMKEIRMLPCSTIFEGFPRMVRDIASQQGKEVNLEISGEDTELDKKVLEGIKTSLMHILRNCIDHGIEEPEKRQAAGKPTCGTLRLSACHEAGNVVIVIEDDGKGIDLEEIKEVALKKRLVSVEELKAMTEKEILDIIFMNGYSTSPIITDVSGRGIGLDVVRHDTESLKSQVLVETQKAKGTKFTLVLPLTIAIIQVLLVKTKGMSFAIPMTSIVESFKANIQEFSTIEGRMAIQIRGHTMPVMRLDEVMALPSISVTEDEQQKKEEGLSVIVVTSLSKQVGFIVDEIVGEEEIFIKSLGKHLGKVSNVSGAAILGTGEVLVILDVADLIAQSRLNNLAVAGGKAVTQEKKEKKRVLVVEDALSTRELVKSILETQGYEVYTAVDGLDALDKISISRVNLVVTDIQMPRMDGFELCKCLKKNEQYKDIPVIIVTALEKDEDKRRGIEVGAQAYIVKSSFDQSNLLDTMARLV